MIVIKPATSQDAPVWNAVTQHLAEKPPNIWENNDPYADAQDEVEKTGRPDLFSETPTY